MSDSRLTHYELELLDVLWRIGEGTVQDVCDGLQRDLAYTTVMTTLRLLENKKRVLKRIKRGRAYVYRPIVSREQMSESILSQLKDVLFGEKLPSLMLNLIDRDRLTDADLQHLKEAVRRLEADSERGS